MGITWESLKRPLGDNLGITSGYTFDMLCGGMGAFVYDIYLFVHVLVEGYVPEETPGSGRRKHEKLDDYY